MPIDLQSIDTGAARLRVAITGEGPLIVLVHGFPESWYSWRHQIPVLADAGFRVAAPDVRGYGGSDRPHAIDAYAIKEMCGDIAGLISALGARQAVVVGHDWGAPIAYATALFHPARVRAVAGLSAPYLGRGPMPSVELFRKIYQDRFFYQLYFQEPGVAEAELEADIRISLRKFYYGSSGEARKADDRVANPAGPGLLDRLVDPAQLPSWLTEADLDYYESRFRESGFRGPLNRYRNSERDFADMAEFDGQQIAQPAAFLAGSLEPILGMIPGVDMVELMRAQCADLRLVRIMEGAGHWLQQERPAEVNAALLEFLGTLPGI
ncbi:alpha/beta fold hydrolase [Afipia sp. GAS231]|uniref:alpha/beta fold hydrolase n=1 Tax=Afipia sp. GAS231 TaxID=1882747 RepID=UPI0008796F60|nr:alpha/beta hydrolase [Afipia sp. GAS231]SDN08807.1 Pimeloyl-ACP methyl ester carboxylesterase [Afipia sp. GAS231]